jgi:hypothetical protein
MSVLGGMRVGVVLLHTTLWLLWMVHGVKITCAAAEAGRGRERGFTLHTSV